MVRRRAKDYDQIWKALISEASKHSLVLKPKTCMFDFELAAIISCKQNFSQVKVTGCLFHFGQSLFKHFVKSGMKTLYISDLNVQIWFKKVFILALMPIEFVSVLFQVQTNLSDLCLEAQQKLPSFIEYVKTTYIESEVFPITLWNHFQTEDEKTNNRVEGDNFQMNDCCGAAHPDMAKAVKLLQGYESKAADKYTNASKKEARVASSRLADHDRDRDFRAARKLYHQKRLRSSNA